MWCPFCSVYVFLCLCLISRATWIPFSNFFSIFLSFNFFFCCKSFPTLKMAFFFFSLSFFSFLRKCSWEKLPIKCHNFWNLKELMKGMNGDCLGFSFIWKPREPNCRTDCLHFRSGSTLPAIFGSEISLRWLLIEVTPIFSRGGVSGLSAEIGANFYPPLFSTSRIKVRLFNQLFFPFKLTFSALNILKMKII